MRDFQTTKNPFPYLKFFKGLLGNQNKLLYQPAKSDENLATVEEFPKIKKEITGGMRRSEVYDLSFFSK